MCLLIMESKNIKVNNNNEILDNIEENNSSQEQYLCEITCDIC